MQIGPVLLDALFDEQIFGSILSSLYKCKSIGPFLGGAVPNIYTWTKV